MSFSYLSLRVVEKTEFDRKWNSLCQELQRRVITVTTPLMLQDGISGGINISLSRNGKGISEQQVSVVKISSNAAGGGKYNGKICTGVMTIDGTGNLSMPEDLDVPADDNALILNTEEDTLGTHWLKANSFAVGLIVGSVDASDPPITIVELPCGTARTDSPKTVGSDAEGSETAEATTWSRTSASDGPLDLWVCSRVVYNPTGDKIVYGFARKLTFAADGKLVAVSGETRYEISQTCVEEQIDGGTF